MFFLLLILLVLGALLTLSRLESLSYRISRYNDRRLRKNVTSPWRSERPKTPSLPQRGLPLLYSALPLPPKSLFQRTANENEAKLLQLSELPDANEAATILRENGSNGELKPQPKMAQVSLINGRNGSQSIEESDLVGGDGLAVEEDVHCLLCNAHFNLLLNRRFVCKVCALSVCRNCSLFDDPDWICTVCDQQRAISSQLNCQSWLCKRIKSSTDKELVHLVNAKVRFEAEHASNGHGGVLASNGSIPNGTNGTNGTSSSSLTTTTEESDRTLGQEAPFLDLGGSSFEHLIALRSDVELIVVKLLGIESIDYAHVGLLFDDAQYSELIQTYTESLARLLSLLQESIYTSQSGKEPSLPPTVAYNQLKDLLSDISEKSFLFTPLRPLLRLNLESYLRASTLSYEALLANSIVNQIVEVSQTRFLTPGTLGKSGSAGVPVGSSASTSLSGHYSPSGAFARLRSSCSGGSSLYAHSNESTGTAGSDTVAKTADDYSSYDGSLRNGGSQNMNSTEAGGDFDDVDEVELEEEEEESPEKECCYLDSDSTASSDDSFDINLDFEPEKVNFPEAGVDLVDSRKFPSVDSDLSVDSGIKLIDNTSSWQDNWRFKKHKENKSYHQYHLHSDLHYGYMALALSDPVPMLIPNPSQPYPPLIGEAEVDDISDLSEHNSETASVEDLFSDLDDDDEEMEAGDAIERGASKGLSNGTSLLVPSPARIHQVNLSKEALHALAANAKWKRWVKIKVPDFVPSELRTICSSIPNSHQTNLEYVPSISLKPGNASVHSGIVAQFVCKATGLLPLYFAWYKDGQLIGCSDDQRAGESTLTMEENSETRQRQLARVYFGIRFTYRRTVEPPLHAASYRLIVFNDSECILEMKKTSPAVGGTYSVVAYNHAGYDWADFTVSVDRAHYTASLAVTVPTLSPRPVRRRPQNKPRKSLVCTVIEQQQLSIINHLVKAVSHSKTPLTPLPRPRSISPLRSTAAPAVSESSTMEETNGQLPPTTPEPISNFKQRTWKEREAELVQNGEDATGEEVDGKVAPVVVSGRSSRSNSAVPTGGTVIFDSNQEAVKEQVQQLAPLSCAENGVPVVMEIADRQHRKWLNPDVELENNPYTEESIQLRAKQMLELSSLEETKEPEAEGGGEDKGDSEDEEGFEKKKFNSDRDINRYKRDYYLPKNRPTHEDSQVFSILNTMGGTTNGTRKSPNALLISNGNLHSDSEVHSPEPTEVLEEIEETVEPCLEDDSICSEAPISFSESEISEVDIASPIPPPEPTLSSSIPLVNGHSSHSTLLNGNAMTHKDEPTPISRPTIISAEAKSPVSPSLPSLTNGSKHSSLDSVDLPKSRPLKDQVLAKLPSVKNLVSLFSNNKDSKDSHSGTASPVHSSSSSSSSSPSHSLLRPILPHTPVRNANNYKVHSLTARSMPREFREQSAKQLPRTTNRISLSNEMLGNGSRIVEQTETDSQSIPNSTESLSSDDALSSNHSSLSASSSGGKNPLEEGGSPTNEESDQYRPILQRAHYWQKRMEEGLVSDQKVKAPFPTMDGSKGAVK